MTALPVAPLMGFAAARAGMPWHPPTPNCPECLTGTHFSRQQFADSVKVSVVTVRSWWRNGVPLWSADRAAVRLGVHPAAIWPEWFDLDTQEAAA